MSETTGSREFIAENPTADESPPLFRYPDPITYTAPPKYNIRHIWSVTGLRTATNDKVRNAIAEVFWEVTGTDANGNEGKYSGSTQFNFMDKNPDSLVPYDDLTEQEIIGWIKGAIGERQMDHINGQITLDIQIKKSTISMESSTLPWLKK